MCSWSPELQTAPDLKDYKVDLVLQSLQTVCLSS